MDLSFTPRQHAFRREIRDWIAAALPADLASKAARSGQFGMDEAMRWHKILYDKGWVAPHWPVEHGGPGFDATERFIMTEELELAGTPQLSPFGLVMVGPLLMQFGSEQQQKQHLPGILSGDVVWCQGYSEPNAGSDLASLQMRAEDDGAGHLIVNGQKTWTTYAQYADWIFCLVRTGAKSDKKQTGISFLLIDMKSDGIEIRPTETIGGTESFCDTFFSEVKVPQGNIVGPRDGGWTVAKALLGHERTAVAAVGTSRRAVRMVKQIAAETVVGDGTALDKLGFKSKIARLESRLRSLQMASYRALASSQKGRAPGPESSILKLVGSEILQEVYVLAMEVMGLDSLSWFNEPGVVPPLCQWVASNFAYLRATTIYAGSSEIQKNIIAKRILGLPSR